MTSRKNRRRRHKRHKQLTKIRSYNRRRDLWLTNTKRGRRTVARMYSLAV